jgi:Tol biopolymer transport system component
MMRRRMVTLTVVILASCTSSPPLPPLLVVTDDYAVTAISPDGETVELVGAEPDRVVSQATWAPDGRLAVWTEFDQAAGEAVIAMGNSEGQRRIDGGTIPYFYAWSPQGAHVAYLGNSPDGTGVAMGIVDVSAGTARLVDSGAPYYLDWAPDGSRLAVHIDTAFLGFVDLDGNRTALTAVPGFFQAPEFLDDGRLLVATGGDEAGVSVLGESGEPVLIAPITGGTFLAASSDGSSLAFSDTSAAPFLGSLAVIPIAETSVDGEAAQTVSEGPVVAFEWSPSGRQLLFLTVNADGSALIPQVWEAGSVQSYEELVPTQEMISQYLPFWDQYSRVLTLWSPDGTSFVLPVAGENGGSIVVYDVEGGETTRVLGGRFATWAPSP